MTIQTIEIIMSRIDVANPASPIAVFECGKRDSLNAVFADTVETRRWIKRGKDYFGYNLIGVFDRYMEPEGIIETLRDAL